MGAINKQKSFAAGALLLMLSNLIVKVIGALLKIPLTNLIGLEGMAYYGSAYQIYALLFLISTSGLPVAVSRLVAKSSALGRRYEVERIFRVSLAVFFCVGTAGTLIMMFGADSFAAAANMPDAARAVLMVSPTVMLVCIVSAIRGYFQGLRSMVPTAVSQLTEAVVKLVGGYAAASYAMNKGYPMDVVAAYAISGVPLGVLISTVYLIACYILHGREPCELRDPRSRSTVRTLAVLLRITVPVSLTAAALYLTNIIDLMTIVNLLEPVFGRQAAELMYSTYSNIAVTLSNMPSTVIYAIATSALPALAAAIALKQNERVRASMRAALRLTVVFAMPCAVGMLVLSRGVISFVYNAETMSQVVRTAADSSVVTALDVASRSLSILAVGIVFITLYSTTNALMQSYGLEWFTIVSVLCGAGIKLVLGLILMNIEELNIYGAAISSVACYVAAVAMNARFLRKKTGRKLRVVALSVRPLAAAAACGVSAWCVYTLVMLAIGDSLGVRTANAAAVLPAILVAAVVYFVVLLLLRGVPEKELRMLPKGEKICAVLRKVKLI